MFQFNYKLLFFRLLFFALVTFLQKISFNSKSFTFILKKLHRYVSCSQKWVGMWKISVLLRSHIFWSKMKNYWWNTVLWSMERDWKNFEKKKFHSAPVFNDKYLKIEVRSYKKKINTNFHGKAPKEGLVFLCLSAIAIDSVFK